MASFTAGTTFTDGVANDVTAAKLAALVNAATPTSGFIQDRTAETTIDVNDTLLVGDASDSNNLKRITVANFAGTLPTATITSGTITNLASTTGTIATLNSTTGTITTGVIPTLTSTTLITTGTGTAASPAIVPTGDSNTGVFFPAADTIAFSEGGAEAMRIDSNGNVLISSDAGNTLRYLDVQNTNSSANAGAILRLITRNVADSGDIPVDIVKYKTGQFTISNTETNAAAFTSFNVGATERLRIDSSGNVGIGTASPGAKIHVQGAGTTSAAYTNGDAVGQTLYLQDTGNLAGNGGQILFGASQGVFAGIKSSIVSGTGPAGNLILQTRDTSGNVLDRMTVTREGNVGIGTTSPSSVGGILSTVGSSNIGTGFFRNLATSGITTDQLQVSVSQSANLANFYFSRFYSNVVSSPTVKHYVRGDGDGYFAGNVGIGTASPSNKLEVVGSFGRGAPVTKTADFSLADTENWLIVNKGSSCTVTLPAASSWTGREFTIKVITAHAVVSATAASVVPRIGGAAGTAILPATDGAWATLVSNGTTWEIMCGS